MEASSEIDLVPGGAVAQRTAHKILFTANLNTPSGTPAMELTTPDGKRLCSRILGLSYFMPSTGEAVLIAETQNSIGMIVGDSHCWS